MCFLACRNTSLGGLTTGIRPQQITIASKLVKDFTGVMIQPHKVLMNSSCLLAVLHVYSRGIAMAIKSTKHVPNGAT